MPPSFSETGEVTMTHQAGAGELVSMLIETELGLGDRHMAEQIKKYPLAKVESLFHMRMENGQMTFVEDSIDPRFYGRVVLLAEDGLIRIEQDIPMEKIAAVRREAKRKVFVTNAFRALEKSRARSRSPQDFQRRTRGRIGGRFRDPGNADGRICRIPDRLRTRKHPGQRGTAQRRCDRTRTFIYRRTEMIVKKPAIFIYTSEPDREILREICAGIEEEGVFYEIKEQTLVPKDARSTAARFAWQAAQDSMLGSGIGVSQRDVALQMRGLSVDRCVESYHVPAQAQCRKLGANSARAIKKMPFK